MRKQLFVSHAWGSDDDGSDTHARAVALSRALADLGWTVWLDEIDMRTNVDASMAAGIDESDFVLMLMTRRYARKINRAARLPAGGNDNCLKEFAYALLRQKQIVPILFEESMRDVSAWSPGVFPMRLASMLYTDGVGPVAEAAGRIDARLHQLGGRPLQLRRRTRVILRAHSRGMRRRLPDTRHLWPPPIRAPPVLVRL